MDYDIIMALIDFCLTAINITLEKRIEIMKKLNIFQK